MLYFTSVQVSNLFHLVFHRVFSYLETHKIKKKNQPYSTSTLFFTAYIPIVFTRTVSYSSSNPSYASYRVSNLSY